MMPKTDDWRANEKDRDEYSSFSAFFSDEAAPIQVPQISNFMKFHLLSRQAPLILTPFSTVFDTAYEDNKGFVS